MGKNKRSELQLSLVVLFSLAIVMIAIVFIIGVIGKKPGKGSEYECAYVCRTPQRSVGFCENGNVSVVVVSPSDIISAHLMSIGMSILSDSSSVYNFIVVSYGEKSVEKSGSLCKAEVCIQATDSRTHEIVSFNTAIGFGSSEPDAIRKATETCVAGLFKQKTRKWTH